MVPSEPPRHGAALVRFSIGRVDGIGERLPILEDGTLKIRWQGEGLRTREAEGEGHG